MGGKALWFALLTAATCVPGFAQEREEDRQRAEPPPARTADAEAINTENGEVVRLYNEGRLTEERAAAAIERAERELGNEHPLALVSINNLALLYLAQGRNAEAEQLFLQALAAQERVLGAGHLHTIISINNLALLYNSQGRYAEAEGFIGRGLAAQERALGAEHPATLDSINVLALVYESQGRFAEAERLHLQVLSVRERVLGAAHPDTLVSINNLALLHVSQGRYSEAEPLSLRALSARERVLGAEHPYTLERINNLAFVYTHQGRYAEAERVFLRDLSLSERVLGAEQPRTLLSVNNLASLYVDQGRYAEAEPLHLRVLAAQKRVLGPEHPDTLVSLHNLAAAYGLQGRYAEAEKLYLQVLDARERVLGVMNPETLVSLDSLAGLYLSQGRYAEATPLYVRALAAQERVLGAEHPDLIATTGNFAITRLGSFDPEAWRIAGTALRLTRMRARLVDDFRAQFGDDPGIGMNLVAFVYARAAWSASERPPLNNSFEALQLVGPTSVGRALTRSTALATLDRAGQALVLEREDVVGQIEVVDSAFSSAAATEDGGMVLTELQARRATLENRLEAIDAKLEVGYPRYFELIRPQPISLEALRTGKNAASPLLRADEALILLTPGDAGLPEGQRRGFAFAVTREGAAWAELPLDPEPLDALISEVHEGSAIIDPRIQQPVPRERAKALHDALFGAPEIARLIADKPSWIISPQGQLLSTPFAALVTRDPQGDDDDPEAWAGTAWLGVERALAILPEVNMLRSLRGLDRPASVASAPYFGIADPAFEGKGEASEVRGAASYYRGAAGSPEAIIALVPLPSTRAEAQAVARALGAGPETLLLGSAATEAALRAHAPQLANSRVIHFATHALVSGEMGGLTQPALALMPPTGTAGVEELNDGLLTAAEAATLKLNADWVILSACNTAAGGGNGSEGLSGLARSFFYAGAASLLVSQWQVRDDSGAMLVAETVKAFAADPTLGRAEALRRAMGKVIASRNARGESFAHPKDWAPFILVGVDR